MYTLTAENCNTSDRSPETRPLRRKHLLASDDGLPKGDAAVIGRNDRVGQHVEAVFAQTSLGQFEQQYVLKHSTRQSHRVDATSITHQLADTNDHVRHGVVKLRGDRCRRDTVVRDDEIRQGAIRTRPRRR